MPEKQARAPVVGKLAQQVPATWHRNMSAVAVCQASAASPPQPAPNPVFAGGFVFGVTLRLADNCGLGLDVAPGILGLLMVQDVLPKGAVDTWNRQCMDGESASRGKVVVPGDFIVDVNGSRDCADMMRECLNKTLLKLTVVRAYESAIAAAAADAADAPGTGALSAKCCSLVSSAKNVRLHAERVLY